MRILVPLWRIYLGSIPANTIARSYDFQNRRIVVLCSCKFDRRTIAADQKWCKNRQKCSIFLEGILLFVYKTNQFNDHFMPNNTKIKLVIFIIMNDLNDLDDLDDLDVLCEPVSSNSKRWEHERINWHLHVKKLLHEKHFTVEYRMSYSAFSELCLILS